jgi:hypothetical protein
VGEGMDTFPPQGIRGLDIQAPAIWPCPCPLVTRKGWRMAGPQKASGPWLGAGRREAEVLEDAVGLGVVFGEDGGGVGLQVSPRKSQLRGVEGWTKMRGWWDEPEEERPRGAEVEGLPPSRASTRSFLACAWRGCRAEGT